MSERYAFSVKKAADSQLSNRISSGDGARITEERVTARAIKRLFIANRGEIAVRVIRAARELGIESVLPYSDADAGTLPARLADRRIALRGSTARDTYLNKEKLINAALQEGCDAVHPGYGFLAENADFAALVQNAGMIFVGPLPETISLMGDKHRARETAIAAGVPVVPGTKPGASAAEIRAFGKKVGFPLMAKAVAGGSGRGMRLIESEKEIDEKVREASAEAESAFGNGELFVEKCILLPRHIEFQVFGDHHGNYIHCYERECSLQRRHQKVVEEAPAPRFHPGLRAKMATAAIDLCRKVGYRGAGTLEFLVEGGEEETSPFYFLEMNTRIQVEHTVTEEVLGLDLVRLQLAVAQGAPLEVKQEQLAPEGHAFQFRVYAENPREGFRPLTGEVKYLLRSGGPGVREDSWAEAGTRVSPYYDSLLSKIVVWGEDREQAISRASRVLRDFTVEGVETTLSFHRWVLTQRPFIEGKTYVKWIDDHYKGETGTNSTNGPLTLPPPYSE